MTDKQIIGGRGSAKPYTTLNTVEVLLELEHVKAENILLREENAIHIRDWEDKKNENYELACKNEILKNENDRLKEARKNSRCAWKSLEGTLCPEAQEQLDKLKAENEELKKLLKVRIEDLCDSCGASSMMPMPCKVYEKTLTEIKEIAESEMDSKEFMAVQCMLNGSVDNKNKVLKQILQKIRECEGNDGL